ncbi:ABC transporter substrate-binding protein [Seongchinamella sediminis]|uniref:ABC transporter substrate-binding protein n=1 Tax=Seongchinamella sediminis TaxID=2283635 RepID=A0A3L7E2X1_9GAMM|nr:transporter substrate-binding domain-containing protein [Seongchinamella sediminis]RLQ23449.1 ABC transporter substrate-binding protein [Seongchinamella sediminis]
MSKILKQLLLGGIIALSLIGGAQAGETLQRIIDFKTLKVGMSADQPPMTTLNRQGGVMGLDVDLARGLAKAMRVELDIKVLPFGNLLEALEKGEIDMILSNMSVTPERSEKAYFIGPYMMTGKSILTRNSVLAEAEDTGAFNRDDLKLAAVANSTSAVFIRENAPAATLTATETSDEAVALLLAGKVDGVIADMSVTKLAVLRNRGSGLVTLKQPLTMEPVGIAVSKDDPEFQNLVDNFLGAFAKTGVLAQLRKKWFEDGDWIAALP